MKDFDVNSASRHREKLFGLPFEYQNSELVVLPVPWDVTASFTDGSSKSHQYILEASQQIDLFDPQYPDCWKQGIYLLNLNEEWRQKNLILRPKAYEIMRYLELGGDVNESESLIRNRSQVNEASAALNTWVYEQSHKLASDGKKVIVLGGDHSVPLGHIRATSKRHPGLGILHFDAHADLRSGYEGFIYSHASIMHHAMQSEDIDRLVMVGVRDLCQAEFEQINHAQNRIQCFYDREVQATKLYNRSFVELAEQIVGSLPEKVYVSIDVDALNPSLCPNTGTPVPGGLDFDQLTFLLEAVTASGRSIVGADLCECGPDPWDANVAARILYKLFNLMVSAEKVSNEN